MQLRGTGGLGYDLVEPATSTGLCNNCHGGENNPGLLGIHDRSDHRNEGCPACHVQVTGR